MTTHDESRPGDARRGVKVCGEVRKHLVADAIKATIRCGKCGRQMDMRGATIEAVSEADAKAAAG